MSKTEIIHGPSPESARVDNAPKAPVCPICSCTNVEACTHYDDRAIVLCSDCRHLFWESKADQSDLATYYSTRYGGDHEQMPKQTENYQYYLNHVDELLSMTGLKASESVFVDYGSSYPVFSLAAREKHVSQSISIDYDQQAIEYGLSKGLACLDPHMFEQKTPENTVDLLRFSHVLEHLISPARDVFMVLNKLKLGGYVYITMPNHPVLKTCARNVPISDAVWPEHLHFFTPGSLMRLLRILGLEPLRFFTHTNADARKEQLFHHIDTDYCHAQLSWTTGIGDPHFEEAGNYPYFAGANSFLIATKTR
jgi:hypothetical protein